MCLLVTFKSYCHWALNTTGIGWETWESLTGNKLRRHYGKNILVIKNQFRLRKYLFYKCIWGCKIVS